MTGSLLPLVAKYAGTPRRGAPLMPERFALDKEHKISKLCVANPYRVIEQGAEDRFEFARRA